VKRGRLSDDGVPTAPELDFCLLYFLDPLFWVIRREKGQKALI
jgi:hypothetical protein